MRKKENQRHDLWQWEKFLNNKQIKELNKVIKKHLTDGEDEPASTIKTSKVEFCLYKNLKPYLYDILERVKSTNIDHFGYSIYDVNDYDLIHVNTYSYKNRGRYDWHIDAARDYTKDIKFTIIVNLSEEPYEGGNFKLFRTGLPQEQKGIPEITSINYPGSVLMFKSWIPHRVLPVIKGTRKTLTVFINGPRFI